jgi:signal transduction histidine kinase
MVDQNNFDSIILSIIYKISSLKTEEDLINYATPDILKKFNCFSGVIMSFKNFEEKIIVPKLLKNKTEWQSLKNKIVSEYQNKEFNILEIKEQENQFYYIFKLSKYGLLVMVRNQEFKTGTTDEIYNLAEYFGKYLSNAVYELERNTKEKIIAQEVNIQDLLIQISTEYINADLTDLDSLINKSLKNMGEFVEADRSYIFSYDFINNSTSNTYEWCADGIEPEIQNLQDVPVEFIPQWLDKHEKGQAFYIEDLSLLPDDGEFGLKAILEPQGIKSLISIPMIKSEKLIGFVGFDSVKTTHIFSENEKNILFVFANMLVNVRQRKENEEQIKEQEAKKETLLINSEKQNKELSDYAHAVSHDLKAPLRNINALVNWVKDDNEKIIDESSKESLDLVLFNLEKMDNLIKGILDYSTIDKVETISSWINLNEVIDEILKSILIPNNFIIKVDENLPKIFTNNFMIKQVFQNLIQNAINYNDKENGYIELKYVDEQENNLFMIKDNGIGIKKEHHEKIFQSFTKLHENSQSSGLGLSIVKRIIENMFGKIWLESEINKGTTFFFIIPKT